MKIILHIIILSACFASCSIHSEYRKIISRIESYIEDSPDTALVMLKSISSDDLDSKEEKAKYALLMSMALDKNYIDKTDFDILFPAINYYEEKGSATDKLRTFYYQGRIYHNQGNEASAMSCYIRALDEGEKSNDILTKARLLVAQGNIYDSLMKWDRVCEVNLAAAEYFEQEGRINSYVNCLLKAVGGFIHKKDFVNAEKYLNKCSQYLDVISAPKRGSYYSAYLTYLVSTNSKDLTESVVNEYLSVIPENIIDYTSLANAYFQMGEIDKALDIISTKEPNNSINHKLKHYAVLTDIYKQKNDYKQALNSFETFMKLSDSVVLEVFKQDTQFIEERYTLELQTIKERESKNLIVFCGILVLVMLTAVIFYIRTRLKIKTIETERYKLLHQQIEVERDNLSELLVRSADLNKDTRSVVAERLEILNKFFTASITNNFEIERKVDKELEDLLDNREKFMTSTKLAFSGSHPEFIKYLEGKNLTDYEIKYCCLYALGLKGKEVGSYLRMRSHYNISSAVREKLGLVESDTNLGIYIRKLLKSVE